MPRNVYFQNGTFTEQNLFDELVAEALQIYGVDTVYIPRKIIKKDLILNEDLMSEFKKAYPIEMYIEGEEGFQGDGDFLSQFGLEIRDQMTLVVSRLRWNQFVGRFGYEKNTTIPLAGDLVFLPLTKNLFEIKFVEKDKPFYQIGQVPTFTLTVELFEYESQEIDTGFTNIDDIQKKYSQTYTFRVNQQAGEFNSGETVFFALPSGLSASAEFLTYRLIEGSDDLDVIVGPITFDDGGTHAITVGTTISNESGIDIAEILEIYSLDAPSDSHTMPNDPFAQNVTFSSNVQDYIDWSEENPFGEPFRNP